MSIPPTDERGIKALVQLLEDNGELDGHTLGIFTTPDREGNADLAAAELEALGYSVAETAVLDAPLSDGQAVNDQLGVIAQRMEDKGFDTVFSVANFVPAAGFDAAGYYPRLVSQFADTFLAAAATNPLGSFPFVGGIANYDPDEEGFNSEQMTLCREAYTKATGKEVLSDSTEREQGESTGAPALGNACQTLAIFVQAAEAAGEDLNQRTFAEGLISIGEFTFPDGRPASFGPDKPDAADEFELVQLDPDFDPDGDVYPYISIGEPITLRE